MYNTILLFIPKVHKYWNIDVALHYNFWLIAEHNSTAGIIDVHVLIKLQILKLYNKIINFLMVGKSLNLMFVVKIPRNECNIISSFLWKILRAFGMTPNGYKHMDLGNWRTAYYD